jgi:hypothetical protein
MRKVQKASLKAEKKQSHLGIGVALGPGSLGSLGWGLGLQQTDARTEKQRKEEEEVYSKSRQ